MDDVLANKAAAVERCLGRIRVTIAANPGLNALDAQDVVVLNLQRAAQVCIDGAMHVVRASRLGLPQTSRDAFEMLAAAGDIDAGLAAAMMRMVGFQNIGVHEYRALNFDVVRAIATDGLGGVEAFARWMIGRAVP